MWRPSRQPEVHVFVVWSEARGAEPRIRADLDATFRVLGQIRVTWSQGEIFTRSLSRMYGTALPPGSDKEVHCGTGPFLVVVVADDHPCYRIRGTNRGRRIVNSRVFDARRRYRLWTGDGYRVHASDSGEEAERNLVLLFGEGVDEFRHSAWHGDRPRDHAADPVGTRGWTSRPQLVRALEAYDCVVAGAARSGVRLDARAADVWWAERIAGGDEVAPAVRQVSVDGVPVRVEFRQRRGRRVRSVVRFVRPLVNSVLPLGDRRPGR